MGEKERRSREGRRKVTDRRKSNITNYEQLNLDRPDRRSGTDRRKGKERRVN